MSGTQTTILNLNEPVTRDQYQQSVEGLSGNLQQQARTRDWCSARHRYFTAVIPEYVAPPRDESVYTHGTLNFGAVPETDYAARLRGMRARLLWYAKAGTITLDTANQMLTAAGWPRYGEDDSGKSGVRLVVYLPPLRVNVTEPRADARAWAREHMPELIVRGLEALNGGPQNDNRYVPGSAELEHAPEVYFLSEVDASLMIRDSDTERPSVT